MTSQDDAVPPGGARDADAPRPVYEADAAGGPLIAPVNRDRTPQADAGMVVQVKFASSEHAQAFVASRGDPVANAAQSPAHLDAVGPLRRRVEQFGGSEVRLLNSPERIEQARQRVQRRQQRSLAEGARIAARTPSEIGPASANGADTLVHMRFPDGTPRAEVLAALRSAPHVDSVSVVPRAARPAGMPAPIQLDPLVGSQESIVPDPVTQLESQWYLHRMDFPNAWLMATGQGVVVADIDWGCRTTHDDLAAGIDLTWNAADNGTIVNLGSADDVGHGTAVMGLVGARNDGAGMEGCAPDARLWAIQVGSGVDEAETAQRWVDALDHVAQLPAGGRRKVIILEVQTENYGNYEQILSVNQAVREAIADGCVVCVAAGNGGQRADRTDGGVPFDPTGSILVGATLYSAQSNVAADFSNYGPNVVVCAPGDPAHDLTCGAGADNYYRNGFGGTSGATPKVAGVAALILEANPNLTHDAVRDILVRTGAPVQGDPGRPIGSFVNAQAAVTEALRRADAATPAPVVAPPVAAPADVTMSQFGTAALGAAGSAQAVSAAMIAALHSDGSRVANSMRLAPALDGTSTGANADPLQAIQKSLASLAAGGKQGSVAFTKGDIGLLPLHFRSKALEALDRAAQTVVEQCSPGERYVLATRADVDAALHASVLMHRLQQHRHRLATTLATARHQASAAPPMLLPAVLAAAQVVPSALSALSNAMKFFRVDRTTGVFDLGDEATHLLHLLIEARAPDQVEFIDDGIEEGSQAAHHLLHEIDDLGLLCTQAREQMDRWTGGAEIPPPPEALASLTDALEGSRALVDAVHPDKAPDVYWQQVAALWRHQRLAGRGIVEAGALAQTLETQEKRAFLSDRMMLSGAVQLTYRITGAKGRREGSGVVMFTSAAVNAGKSIRASMQTFPRLDNA